MLERLLAGIGAGISFAFLGYAKSKGEKMDWTKFGTTVVIGTIIGIVNQLTGIEMDVISQYLMSVGAVGLVEMGLKAIKRRVFG